jgi:hypothetical protein
LQILQQTTSILFWRGDGPAIAVIADPAVRDHLREDVIEALGEPMVVTDGLQILEAIRKS